MRRVTEEEILASSAWDNLRKRIMVELIAYDREESARHSDHRSIVGRLRTALVFDPEVEAMIDVELERIRGNIL